MLATLMNSYDDLSVTASRRVRIHVTVVIFLDEGI